MSTLADKLKKKIDAAMEEFRGKPLNRETIAGMQTSIRENVVQMFNGGSSPLLSPEAVSWLTNNFLRGVKSTDDDGEFTLQEVVVFNDYELHEIKYQDVVLLETLFKNFPFGAKLTQFVNRNLS